MKGDSEKNIVDLVTGKKGIQTVVIQDDIRSMVVPEREIYYLTCYYCNHLRVEFSTDFY